MRFQVPQFIDIEEKVFGPLTFKQFIYLAGGAGIAVVCFVFLPRLVAFLFASVGVIFAAALAFYKINDKPFSFFLENAIRYTLGSRLFIWRKVEKKPVAHETPEEPPEGLAVPRLSDSRLRDLAWSLDVHDTIYDNGGR